MDLSSSMASLLGLHDVFVWLSERPLVMPQLAEPLWLWLLLVPLALFLWRMRARKNLLHDYADASLQPWAIIQSSQKSIPWPARIQNGLIPFFWLFFWLSLALTLAGPEVPKAKEGRLATRPPVLFLVDDTAAMSVADVSPDRQSRAVALLELLGQVLNTHRLGLMVDNDQAGLLLPPTGDPNLFYFYLRQLSALKHPAVVPRPDRAFDWIARMPSMHGGAVVWLTSGDSASFQGVLGSRQLAAAKALEKAHVCLIALTVAGEGGPLRQDGMPLKNTEDQLLTSQPLPQRVAELAGLTGGLAEQTQTLPHDVAFIRQAVDALPSRPPGNDKAKAQRSLHALPLLLAWIGLLLLAALMWRPPPLAWLRRPRVKKGAVIASPLIVGAACGGLFALALSTGAFAAETGSVPDHSAASWSSRSVNEAQMTAGNRALQRGDYAEAQVAFSAAKGYAARFGTGLAAFRRADYAFAIDQWQMALVLAKTPEHKAIAAFNLGDALTLAGRYAAARDAFSYVLTIAPISENLTAAALTNRGIVQELLQSLAKNGKNSPRFQGYQAAKYGYSQDPKTSRMDKEIQKSQGVADGAAQAPPADARPFAPFVPNTATERSARSKLTLIHDAPAPLLEGLLRQQPYHLPAIPGKAPSKEKVMP